MSLFDFLAHCIDVRPGRYTVISVFDEHGLQELTEAFGKFGTVGAGITGLHRFVAMCAHHTLIVPSGEHDASGGKMVERCGQRVDVAAAVELHVAVHLFG